jgi:TolB-like protein
LWIAFLLAHGLRQAEAQSSGDGALLPLQDRVGDPVLASTVQETLRGELMGRYTLVDRVRLRDALRRLRLRDISLASADILGQLAEDVSVDWFFSATLHMATETELSRATQAFIGAATEPVPQIILSARVFRIVSSDPGRIEADFAWAGFVSASGLDRRSVLGLGVVEDPELLAGETAQRLVAAFLEPERVDAPSPDRGGFLRDTLSTEEMGTVAVLPFEGVSDREANIAADTVTQLALAVLQENGIRISLPGEVNQILRRRGILLRGEIDSVTRDALREGGIDHILTGTVENWEVRRRGTEPEPRVSFGARLLDAASGQILWMNGQDREGWDGLNLFGTRRTHSKGRLAQQMMRSLVAGFLESR